MTRRRFKSSPRDESVRLADADMSAHFKFLSVKSASSVVEITGVRRGGRPTTFVFIRVHSWLTFADG